MLKCHILDDSKEAFYFESQYHFFQISIPTFLNERNVNSIRVWELNNTSS